LHHLAGLRHLERREIGDWSREGRLQDSSASGVVGVKAFR